MAGQLPTVGLMYVLPKEGDHPSVCGFGGSLLGCLSKDRVTISEPGPEDDDTNPHI